MRQSVILNILAAAGRQRTAVFRAFPVKAMFALTIFHVILEAHMAAGIAGLLMLHGVSGLLSFLGKRKKRGCPLTAREQPRFMK
jgi:multisubunit Na+/H+ antiporter MnhC subunit